MFFYFLICPIIFILYILGGHDPYDPSPVNPPLVIKLLLKYDLR